jgi:hypothetical protein
VDEFEIERKLWLRHLWDVSDILFWGKLFIWLCWNFCILKIQTSHLTKFGSQWRWIMPGLVWLELWLWRFLPPRPNFKFFLKILAPQAKFHLFHCPPWRQWNKWMKTDKNTKAKTHGWRMSDKNLTAKLLLKFSKCHPQIYFHSACCSVSSVIQWWCVKSFLQKQISKLKTPQKCVLSSELHSFSFTKLCY